MKETRTLIFKSNVTMCPKEYSIIQKYSNDNHDGRNNDSDNENYDTLCLQIQQYLVTRYEI